MPPVVSVLLPVHNAAPYLRQAVDSILSQSFTDFELLLMDDGSTDGSADIAAAYTDPRIKLKVNPRNLGLIATLNRGLELAQSRYVARMDADDIALPHRLERQVALLEADSSIGLAGGWMQAFGARRGVFAAPRQHDYLHALTLFRCPLYHPTVVFRRELFADLGLRYATAMVHAEDYDLWERVFAAGVRVANVPQIVLRYRLHPGQVRSAHGDASEITADRVRLRQLRRLGLEPTPAERSLHLDICSGAPGRSTPWDTAAALDWSRKLLAANTATDIYPEPIFSRVLGQQVVKAALRAALGRGPEGSIPLLKPLAGSPLTRHTAEYFLRQPRLTAALARGALQRLTG